MEPQRLPRLSSSVASSSEYSPRTDPGLIHIDPEIFQSPSCRCPIDSSAIKKDMFNLPSPSPPSPQSPSLRYPIDPIEQDTSFNLPSSSPPSSPVIPPSSPRTWAPDHVKLPSPRQCTLEAHARMRHKFEPYKVPGAPPLELRFAMRSLGRSLYCNVRFEDVFMVCAPYFILFISNA